MRLPVRKLLMALAFGCGAVAAPATLIVIEAAKTPEDHQKLARYYDQQAAQLLAPAQRAATERWVAAKTRPRT